MVNSKLFQLLKTFSPNEFKEFGKFVSSPYFNSNSAVERFYDYLKIYYPKFNSNTLRAVIIFNKVFPDREYNTAVLHNLMSSTISLAEHFLVVNDCKEDTFDFNRRLLNMLNRKNLDKLFEKYYRNASALLNEEKIRDENYFHKRFTLDMIKFEFYSARTPIGKSHSLYTQKGEAMDNFINYFLITMLRDNFDNVTVKDDIKLSFKNTFPEELLQHISQKRREYKQIILIDILYRFLVLFQNKQDASFEDDLKKAVVSNKDNIEFNDYRNFMMEIYNHYKKKEAEGLKSYGLKSFRFMNEMLDQGLLYQKDGKLSAHSYINFVASALRENELKWAERFINEYKNKVIPEQRENAFMYSNATLYYVKATHSKTGSSTEYFTTALGYLARVKSEDFYYMTRIKNMLIRIYYELGDNELAISIIDSYKHFLSKTKVIPENIYEEYSNFIFFVSKLIKIRLKDTQLTPAELKTEVQSTKLLAFKGWILEKIAEL